jgi:ArsR family transcriptional regulator, arsenate/arsenite/antimonite-responsive transcriptional repressor
MPRIVATSHRPANQSTESTIEVRLGVLKALADSVRLRLLVLLSRGEETCVCYLHDALELPQSTVSRHLATLRAHNLVSTRRDGLWVHYRLAVFDDPATGRLVQSAVEVDDSVEPFAGDQARLDQLRRSSLASSLGAGCCEPGVELVTISPKKRGTLR